MIKTYDHIPLACTPCSYFWLNLEITVGSLFTKLGLNNEQRFYELQISTIQRYAIKTTQI